MRHFYRIKRHVTIAISSLIFFGLSLNVHGQLPFSDDFESGNFSTGGWDVTGNAEISTQSPAQGSYCVKGPGTYIIAKQFSSINENVVTIEYDMKASQTGSNCVNFKVLDSDEEIAAIVFFRHNGNIVAYDGEGYSQQINLMPYNSDTWYAMKIVLNMSSKTYDVFIDGVLKADNFDFYSMDFTMPYEFNWNSGETWGTGWIDDVSISGSGSPSNLPFEDCFETGNFTAGGWDVTGNAEISTQSPAQGSYCVKGPGTYIIAKQFSSINENVVTIEYDMKASQTGSNCVNFKVLDSDEEIAAIVFFRHNGNIVAYDGEGYSQQINLMPYNSDTWYAMKIVLNMSSKTYDVFIDGVLKADNFDFYSMDFTMPYEFNWNSGETWGTGQGKRTLFFNKNV